VRLWKSRLEQFTKSQLTIHQFCSSVNCSVSTYYHWKRKLEAPSTLAGRSNSPVERGFIPVTIRHEEARVVNVELPGGTKLHLPADAMEALRLIIEHDQRAA
jgi:hypothetical protein